MKLYVNRRTEAGIPSSDKDIETFILQRLLSKHCGKNNEKVKSLSSTWISAFLKRHSDMYVLGKKTNVELSCDICGFSVVEKRKFRIHVDRHAERHIPIYSTRAKLIEHSHRHVKRLHKCQECSAVFENESKLRYHQSTHKEDSSATSAEKSRRKDFC